MSHSDSIWFFQFCPVFMIRHAASAAAAAQHIDFSLLIVGTYRSVYTTYYCICRFDSSSNRVYISSVQCTALCLSFCVSREREREREDMVNIMSIGSECAEETLSQTKAKRERERCVASSMRLLSYL